MTIERRPFGRTGHMSSAVIFGAAALGKVDQATADRVLDLLLEHGVNHIDVAASYGDAELRIGPWMAKHRKDFFLATQDRAARLCGRPGRDPPLARAAAHRPGRPHPAPRADPSRRVGAGAGVRRGARGGGRGEAAGPRALHRRHRARLERRRHAPAQPPAIRLQLHSPALELVLRRAPDLSARFRGRGRPYARSARSPSRRSRRSPGGHGRPASPGTGPPGTSRSRTRRTSGPRSIGCSGGPASSSTRWAMWGFCRPSCAPPRSMWPSLPTPSWRSSAAAPGSPRSSGSEG